VAGRLLSAQFENLSSTKKLLVGTAIGEERGEGLTYLTKRILVVDDDTDIRQVLQDRLNAYGYAVETAMDGAEALDALQRGDYDGMILDIRMPKIDGLEVLRRTRQSHPRLPVIMITASKVKEDDDQAIREGAQELLLKPFDVAQLKQVVERWFGPAE
jgi:CheY-like chemotaxis protein